MKGRDRGAAGIEEKLVCLKRADGCREGAECFWNSAEDTGGRLLVNDEKREEQGLKERKRPLYGNTNGSPSFLS